MNKILINVSQDEVRVAVVRGTTLYDLDLEHAGIEQKKSNIYKGRITRVEPSLEAAFVDYGADKQGFLPLKEISKTYFLPSFSGDFSNINIKDVVKEGQELTIQIDKDERGTKGAALTTFISLAGSYVVLMPNNPRAGGVSRRIENEDRQELRQSLRDLKIPEDMGVIIRTAGIGKSTQELQWDLDTLLKQWDNIITASNQQPSPFLIYQESDIVIRSVRDHLREDILEIIIDHRETYEKIVRYIEQIRPDFVNRIKLYESKVPLFSFYQIERQIETAYKRTVTLHSGGAIVIDHTEALVSIDVNSAKSTGGSDIEETAFKTNLEAAEEIAKQLRLRDIGGLIVIDFIDMTSLRNQREICQKMREAIKDDRARAQIGSISRFGLLEMSRQRLRSYIGSAMQVSCPRCDGQGTIRAIESLATSLIHVVEEEAIREANTHIQVQVPIDLAAFLSNERKDVISEIEQRQKVRVFIIPNQHLETPNYKIKRIRRNDSSFKNEASYQQIETPDTEMPEQQMVRERSIEVPAVSSISASPTARVIPIAPRFPAAKPEKKGLFSKIIEKLSGKDKKEEAKIVAKTEPVKTPTRAPVRNNYYSRRPPNRYNNNRGRYSNFKNTRRGTRGGRDRSFGSFQRGPSSSQPRPQINPTTAPPINNNPPSESGDKQQ